MKRHNQLLLALVAGFVVGTLAHGYADNAAVQFISVHVLRPIGQIFLRTIFMVVVPLVVSALVVGVYELRREHGFGGLAARTLGYTLALSTASVILGVALVNVLRPGADVSLEQAGQAAAGRPVTQLQANAAAAQPLSDVLIQLVPRNPFESAVRALDGDMLPLMLFALALGAALKRPAAGTDERSALVRVLDDVFDASMRIVQFAIAFAPIAVFAIVTNTVATFGTDVFSALLKYVVTVVIGLLLQQFVVYTALLQLRTRRSPVEFFRACRDVYLYAFSTASSNATLPLALEAAETRLRLRPRVARFVLTVGSTANQNGTALFEGVTVLFLAQIYGLDLQIGQQVRVMVMSIVAGIGTAGIPGGSLPMVMLVAASVGIPAEGMALILGVDRFLDMCRTAVNVSGDLVIATVVNDGSAEPEVVRNL
jgi:DAACS family dicarboxylate/amino acid:cation (Na+ or H+) symporter